MEWFGFVVRRESPGCRLISTASMLEWLRNLLPHHSQGSSTERWSRHTLRVVTARVFYVFGGSLTSPLFLIIQWRQQHHLTWSATHEVVSREINPWKSFNLLLGSNLWPLASFNLLLGSNLWPLAPSAECLTARPPELTLPIVQPQEFTYSHFDKHVITRII